MWGPLFAHFVRDQAKTVRRAEVADAGADIVAEGLG